MNDNTDPREPDDDFLQDLWTGIKFNALLAAVGFVLGFNKAVRKTFQESGLLGGPNADSPTLSEIQKTLNEIKRRLER